MVRETGSYPDYRVAAPADQFDLHHHRDWLNARLPACRPCPDADGPELMGFGTSPSNFWTRVAQVKHLEAQSRASSLRKAYLKKRAGTSLLWFDSCVIG